MNTKLSESQSHGQTVFQYNKTASEVKAYKATTAELLKKIKLMRGKNDK